MRSELVCFACCVSACAAAGGAPGEEVSSAAQALEAPLAIAGASASHTHPGSPASNAVDGNPSTLWNAGVWGASQPYLQIDLGGDVPVNRLELVVSQSPAGVTSHSFVGYTAQGAAVPLGTYSGYTADGLVISHTAASHAPVRYVRITTTSSPSWVAWYEIRAYRYIPSGSVSAAPATCSVPWNGTFCSPVQLQAAIPTGEYGRVWVAEAPPGAPELGNWVFDTLGGSASVGWIRAGTYKLELREGASASGAVISSVYVTGQQQPAPSPKLYGYFGAWVPWVARSAPTIDETIAHSNLVWAAPALHGDLFTTAVLNRSDVASVALDGSVLLFGRGTCNGVSQIVYYDGTCTPETWPELPTARLRYAHLLSQLTYQQYQKIKYVFPFDEPDIYPQITDAQLADVKSLLAEVATARFGAGAPIPKLSIIYSYLAIPMAPAAPPVGAASADVVAFNCYPVSYGYATAAAPSGCGPDGAPSTTARFQRLKQLIPGKQYFLLAETALARSRDSLQARVWLTQNFVELRNLAQADAGVVGVLGFTWRGLDPATDGGADWVSPSGMAGAPYDYKSIVIREGQCIAQTGPWQCP